MRFVSSTDIETMGIDAGHVGLVVGGKAHKTFWPKAHGVARPEIVATGGM